jgi:nicotinic acetylcholine receptor, invertebrate
MISFAWFLLSLAALRLDTTAAFTTPNGSHTWNVKRLHDYLMKDYSTYIRPVNNSKDTVKVDVRLGYFWIEDLDEKNQVFTIRSYMRTYWKDFGLVWNSKDFDGISQTRIPPNEIWIPDISVYNSKDAYYSPPTHQLATLRYTGDVFWVPPVNIQTHCDLDMSDFPFDEHVCKIVFGSWVYDDSGVNITSADLYRDADSLLAETANENREWQLLKVTVERNEARYSEQVYPDVTFKFTIKRQSSFTTHLFIGPSVMLCILTPVVFLLPPGSGEKMTFGIGVLITDTLLLGELINYIPTAHPNLPFIAKYFVGNIVMASLSLAISAIIIGFWDKSTTRLSGPHAFFRLIFLGPVATVLCVKKEDFLSTEEDSSGGVREINPDGEEGTESTSGVDPGTDKKRRFMTNYLRNAARSEWRQLAVVFDRLLFVIYCVILAILTLSFARYI